MKVLIVGHSCAPGLGSEPGFTWNWAWQMSRAHQVWVIAHPEYRSLVENYLQSNPNENVRFIWVVPKSRFDYWVPGSNQERGVRLHYWLWLKEAYKHAATVHEQVGFDLVHHVSLSTVFIPPPFWRLSVPTIWGPIGGGQSFPTPFIAHLGDKRIKEFVRSLNLLLLRFSPTLRRSLLHANLVLATNHETKDLLERAGAKNVDMFLDCGIDCVTNVSRTVLADRLTLIWAGRLEPQKGLALALQALSKCKNRNIRLVVAGSGSERGRMESLAQSLGIKENVEFLGRVPHETMETLFRSSDAFVFTSLRDSFGSVILEAMSNGLPAVALNHQGIRAFVPDDACLKVPVNDPQQVINGLAGAFDFLSAKSRFIAENVQSRPCLCGEADLALSGRIDERTLCRIEAQWTGVNDQPRPNSFPPKRAAIN